MDTKNYLCHCFHSNTEFCQLRSNSSRIQESLHFWENSPFPLCIRTDLGIWDCHISSWQRCTRVECWWESSTRPCCWLTCSLSLSSRHAEWRSFPLSTAWIVPRTPISRALGRLDSGRWLKAWSRTRNTNSRRVCPGRRLQPTLWPTLLGPQRWSGLSRYRPTSRAGGTKWHCPPTSASTTWCSTGWWCPPNSTTPGQPRLARWPPSALWFTAGTCRDSTIALHTRSVRTYLMVSTTALSTG